MKEKGIVFQYNSQALVQLYKKSHKICLLWAPVHEQISCEDIEQCDFDAWTLVCYMYIGAHNCKLYTNIAAPCILTNKWAYEFVHISTALSLIDLKFCRNYIISLLFYKVFNLGWNSFDDMFWKPQIAMKSLILNNAKNGFKVSVMFSPNPACVDQLIELFTFIYKLPI